jgi:hypothetical protein
MYLRSAVIRYAPRAVGLMEIEHFVRYAPRAVGLKPSAMQGEACLRGRERNNYAKTIISVYTLLAASALCNTAERNNGQCI